MPKLDSEKLVIKNMYEVIKPLLPENIKIYNENWGAVYLGRQFSTGPTFEMYFNILGERCDIRFSQPKEGQLTVGWGGNTLLTTNNDNNKHDAVLIEQIHFLSDIFKKEAQWREVLASIDLQPMIDEQNAIDKALQEKRESELAKNLKAYEDANISPGIVIIIRKRIEETVQRISGKKVQIGKTFYLKEEVGAKLVSKEWQVKQ